MADIDLVPDSYRRHRNLRRRLKGFGFAYAITVAALVTVYFVLTSSLAREASALEQLKARESAVIQRKARRDTLEGERIALRKQLDVLEKLRGGPPVREVFVSIDRAIDDHVWFNEWKFKRAGEFVEVEPHTVSTGYLIIVPGSEQGDTTKAWRLNTHMEIKARATDHSALADFVDRLARQAVISEVKVLNTHSVREGDRPAIAFELAVVVGGVEGRG